MGNKPLTNWTAYPSTLGLLRGTVMGNHWNHWFLSVFAIKNFLSGSVLIENPTWLKLWLKIVRPQNWAAYSQEWPATLGWVQTYRVYLGILYTPKLSTIVVLRGKRMVDRFSSGNPMFKPIEPVSLPPLAPCLGMFWSTQSCPKLGILLGAHHPFFTSCPSGWKGFYTGKLT